MFTGVNLKFYRLVHCLLVLRWHVNQNYQLAKLASLCTCPCGDPVWLMRH